MDQSIQQAVALIDSKIEELTRSKELLISLGGGASSYSAPARRTNKPQPNGAGVPKKRVMSADARARIAKAQQKRWANIRAEEKKALTAPAPKKATKKKSASVKAKPKVEGLVAPAAEVEAPAE